MITTLDFEAEYQQMTWKIVIKPEKVQSRKNPAKLAVAFLWFSANKNKNITTGRKIHKVNYTYVGA